MVLRTYLDSYIEAVTYLLDLSSLHQHLPVVMHHIQEYRDIENNQYLILVQAQVPDPHRRMGPLDYLDKIHVIRFPQVGLRTYLDLCTEALPYLLDLSSLFLHLEVEYMLIPDFHYMLDHLDCHHNIALLHPRQVEAYHQVAAYHQVEFHYLYYKMDHLDYLDKILL